MQFRMLPARLSWRLMDTVRAQFDGAQHAVGAAAPALDQACQEAAAQGGAAGEWQGKGWPSSHC